MSASDSWHRARQRLGSALAWSPASDDEAAAADWDDEDFASEGRHDEPALRVVKAERHEICVVAVAGYADAQRVADAFRRDTPVMVDLQGCDADAARRVTDFCSGLAYARDGGLRAVADGLFLLSPTHVELSQDGRRGLADSGFYNQI